LTCAENGKGRAWSARTRGRETMRGSGTGDLEIRVENSLARLGRALHPGVGTASWSLIGGRIMGNQQRSAHLGAEPALLLAVVLAAPDWVCGAEPLETIREAFRASSQVLTSGIGKGTYRHYRATGEEDWHLERDADVLTYFDGKKYHIDLLFHRDDFRKETACRIIYDGRVIMGCYLTPGVSNYFEFKPEDYGEGLQRPTLVDFPWDISQLSRNAWNPERLIPLRIEIRQTAEGDLVGSHPFVNTDRTWFRFECPNRFGFNLGRIQVLNVGQPKPAQEMRVEWKQGPSGLWYVRSLDETRVLRDGKNAVWRTRDVLKYTEFEPNATVVPSLFMKDARRPTARSRTVDDRHGTEESDRRTP
jgi:hypothetical protein